MKFDHLNFKLNDEVVCIKPSKDKLIKIWYVYRIKKIQATYHESENIIYLKGFGKKNGFYSWRFELYNPQIHKDVTFYKVETKDYLMNNL